MSTKSFRHTVETEATPEAIWQQWSDVSLWPAQDPDTTSVILNGPFATGTSGTLKPKSGPTSKILLTEVVPNKTFTTETPLPLAKLYFVHTLTHSGDTTRFTHEIKFTGLMAPAFMKLIGAQIQKGLPSVMENIARMATTSHT